MRAHLQGAGDIPFGAVQHKAALRLDRAADMDRRIGRDTGIDADIGEQPVQADPIVDRADADAQRAVRIVNAHRDHRMVETRIAHAGHGQQQPASQIARLGHAATFTPRSSAASISRRSIARRRLSPVTFWPRMSVQ